MPCGFRSRCFRPPRAAPAEMACIYQNSSTRPLPIQVTSGAGHFGARAKETAVQSSCAGSVRPLRGTRAVTAIMIISTDLTCCPPLCGYEMQILFLSVSELKSRTYREWTWDFPLLGSCLLPAYSSHVFLVLCRIDRSGL